MTQKASLAEALEAGPIERIEIDLMPNKQFRWKLWCEGKMIYCAAGKGTKKEIVSMIESTKLITHVMMGVPVDE